MQTWLLPAWSGSENLLSLPNEVVRNWTQRREGEKGGGETHINLTMTNGGSFVTKHTEESFKLGLRLGLHLRLPLGLGLPSGMAFHQAEMYNTM